MPGHADDSLARISAALGSETAPDSPAPQKSLQPQRRSQLAFEPSVARERFLTALARTGNVSQAAHYARINRDTAYAWRDAEPAFAAAWQDALDQAGEFLEHVAWRRAVRGVEEPVYQGGELVGTVQKYSDTLLIFLLKAANPAKFRESVRHEHTGESGGPINVQFFTFNAVAAALTDGSAEDR